MSWDNPMRDPDAEFRARVNEMLSQCYATIIKCERLLIEGNLQDREFDGIPIKDHIADVKSEIAR